MAKHEVRHRRTQFMDPELREYIRHFDIASSALMHDATDKDHDPYSNTVLDSLEALIDARRENTFNTHYSREMEIGAQNLQNFLSAVEGPLMGFLSQFGEVNLVTDEEGVDAISVEGFGRVRFTDRIKEGESFGWQYADKLDDTKPNTDFYGVRVEVETDAAHQLRHEGERVLSIAELLNTGPQDSSKGYRNRFEEYEAEHRDSHIDLMQLIRGFLLNREQFWSVRAYKPIPLVHGEDRFNVVTTSQDIFDIEDRNLRIDYLKWEDTSAYRRFRRGRAPRDNDLTLQTQRAQDYFERFAINVPRKSLMDIEGADQAIAFPHSIDGNRYRRIMLRKDNLILDLYTNDMRRPEVVKLAQLALQNAGEVMDGGDYPLSRVLIKYSQVESGYLVKRTNYVRSRDSHTETEMHPELQIDTRRINNTLSEDYLNRKGKRDEEKGKDNEYESIHIQLAFGGSVFEFQIRDKMMHYKNEVGVASHEEYKADRVTNIRTQRPGLADYIDAFFGKGAHSDAAYDKVRIDTTLRRFDKDFGEFLEAVDWASAEAPKDIDEFVSDYELRLAGDQKFMDRYWEELHGQMLSQLRRVVPNYIRQFEDKAFDHIEEVSTIASSLVAHVLESRKLATRELTRSFVRETVHDYRFNRISTKFADLSQRIDTYETSSGKVAKTDRISAYIIGHLMYDASGDPNFSQSVQFNLLVDARSTVELAAQGYREVRLRKKYQAHNAEVEGELTQIPRRLTRKDWLRYRNNLEKNISRLGFDQETTNNLIGKANYLLNELTSKDTKGRFKYQL